VQVKHLQSLLYDMIAILINNDLQKMRLQMFHDLLLYLTLTLSILNNLLYNSTAIAMQTDKQQLLFDKIVNDLFMFFRSNLNVFLNDVISEFVVDQFG
jgi:hypothetical protein